MICFRLWYQDVNISLVPRPPPFLPSVCVRNITFCSCVLLWTQTEGKNGGGLRMRLRVSCNNDPLQFSILSAMNAGSIEHNVSIINYVLNEIVEWSSTEMKGETTCEIKLFPEVLHSVNNFIQHIFTTWSRTISWDGSASGCELDKDEFSKSLSIVVISSAPKQAKYLELKASRVYWRSPVTNLGSENNFDVSIECSSCPFYKPFCPDDIQSKHWQVIFRAQVGNR